MFGRVSMCCLRCVVGCVNVGVYTRWLLLCGGDGPEEKTTSVISNKCPTKEFISITVFINSKNLKTRIKFTNFTVLVTSKDD